MVLNLLHDARNSLLTARLDTMQAQIRLHGVRRQQADTALRNIAHALEAVNWLVGVLEDDERRAG